MKHWWQGLAERERRLAGGGAVLALVLLCYALVWQPFQERLKKLRQAVAEGRAELAWMRQAAPEVKRLSGLASAASAESRSGGQSLLTLVDQTARTAGLGSALTRVEPQGNEQLKVSLEKASFDTLVRWLGALEQEYGVTVVNGTVDRRSENGQVDARLTLQGGA